MINKLFFILLAGVSCISSLNAMTLNLNIFNGSTINYRVKTTAIPLDTLKPSYPPEMMSSELPAGQKKVIPVYLGSMMYGKYGEAEFYPVQDTANQPNLKINFLQNGPLIQMNMQSKIQDTFETQSSSTQENVSQINITLMDKIYESKVNFAKPSLKEMYIKVIAEKILDGQFTLEQIANKYMLPLDLIEEVEEYLNIRY